MLDQEWSGRGGCGSSISNEVLRRCSGVAFLGPRFLCIRKPRTTRVPKKAPCSSVPIVVPGRTPLIFNIR